MTTTITTYHASLEAIRDGSDAVCTDCGWMGDITETSGLEYDYCPKCYSTRINFGADEIAAYALEQGEKVKL